MTIPMNVTHDLHDTLSHDCGQQPLSTPIAHDLHRDLP